jgi:hypothetical protein
MQVIPHDGGVTVARPGFTSTKWAPQGGGSNAPQHQSQAQVIAASEAARGQVGAAQAGAVGNAAAARPGGIAGAYGAYAGLLGQTGGNMAQMFDSYGRNSGAYFNAIANLGANAMNAGSAVNTGLFGAYAGGQQAYQNMLGNLGAAGLAGYGQAANSAMQSQAMNSTAFAKAMADAIAANQAAVSSYGAGRDQSLAALGGAMGAAGGNIANAFSQNAAAAGQMAGMGSSALANLGGTLGTAAGNTASGQAQAEAALRASAAQAAGQLGSSTGASQAALQGNLGQAVANTQGAQAQGLSNLGASGNAALQGLAAPMANAAGNDLTFTRDMAKLGLARELGLAGTNAASAGMAGMGGGGSDPFSMMITGPDGTIASGSAPGFGGFGFGGQSTFADPYQNVPWYAQRQESNQAGLQALSGLQSQIQGNTGALAGQMQGSGQQALGMLGNQAATGSADINRAFDRSSGQIGAESAAGGQAINAAGRAGMDEIRRQGDAAGSGILASLAQGGRQIDDSLAGVRDAAGRAFSGMDASQNAILSSGVLNQLAGGYQGGMQQLQNAFQQGQRDPREIFGQVRGDIQALSQPFLNRGAAGMGDFYNNFPDGPAWGGVGGGSTDPMPYLNALNSAYDPFLQNLNTAYTGSFAGLMNMADRGGSGYGDALGAIGPGATLGGLFGSDAVGGQTLSQPSPYVEALGMTPAARIRQQQDAFLAQQEFDRVRADARRNR